MSKKAEAKANETSNLKRFQTNFDANKLRDLIKEGKTCSEIMQAFNLKHKQVLKHYHSKLIAMDRVFYEITGLYERSNRKCYVNAKGNIVFKMNLIDFNGMDLRPDVEFDVEVIGNKIILTNLSMEVKNDSDAVENQIEAETINYLEDTQSV